MHEIHTRRNCIARIEVVSHSTSHVDSERDVLSLRVEHPVGSLGVNAPNAEAYIKIGRDLPSTRDKITSNTHQVSEIPVLRSPGNSSDGPGELHIPIAA